MPEKKEPMIGQENRPTAIDYDAPIRDFKLRDLYSLIQSQVQHEYLKSEKETTKVEKEHFKVEKELLKVEKEHLKTEKEHFKGEKEKEHLKGEKEKEHLKGEKEKEHFKEFIKPEKEVLKGEKELSKPEKTPFDTTIIDQIAEAVVQRLRAQNLSK
jgi:hypothetical protein